MTKDMESLNIITEKVKELCDLCSEKNIDIIIGFSNSIGFNRAYQAKNFSNILGLIKALELFSNNAFMDALKASNNLNNMIGYNDSIKQ